MKNKITGIDRDVKPREIKDIYLDGATIIAVLFSGEEYIAQGDFEDLKTWWRKKSAEANAEELRKVFKK